MSRWGLLNLDIFGVVWDTFAMSQGGGGEGIPGDVTSFVGRREDVAALRDVAASARLVTLVGLGGVGKTRLVLRTAAELEPGFADGVVVVELAGLREGSLLVQTVAQKLGVRDIPGRPSIEVLSEHLADRSCLLVLDNCEHLIEESAQLIAALLRAGSGLRVLATSREPLRVRGEHLFQVRPLSFPEPGGDVSGLRNYSAVGLFVDRARAVVPDFDLDEANAGAVANLCRKLDGVPLAIELAAVRLRTLSVRQIVDRLDDRFRLLRHGARGAEDRQRTITALLDWSFELCSEAERALWARLSVFADGFELDDVEAVCSDEVLDRADVVDVVAGLVDKSVVVSDLGAGQPRFRLIETLAEYGLLRLRESGEEATWRRRHRDWCVSLAERARDDWYGADQLVWLRRLEREHANLQLALKFSFDDPSEARDGLRLAADLRTWWIPAGFMAEGRQWLERGRSACSGRDLTTARALLAEGGIAILQGDFPGAERILPQAEDIIEESDDGVLRAHLMTLASQLAMFRGEHDAAFESLRPALAAHKARGDVTGIVESLLPYALLMSTTGNSQRAIALCQELEDLCVGRGESVGRSYALWTMGMEAWRHGQVQSAKEALRRSLRLKATFHDRLGIALCFEGLAWISAAEGRAGRAARLLGANEPVARSLGLSLQRYRHLLEYREQCQALLDAQDAEWVRAETDAGASMLLDAAIEYALEDEETAPEPVGANELDLLTPRERSVAELIARGLTNREIAAQLVIAQRTAEGHVEKILGKLGFHTRAQVASWLTAQRAVG